MAEFLNVAGPRGWRVAVVIEGNVCGHIDDGNGVYRYFEGPQNDIIWSFSERTLERMKARILATALSGQQAAESRPVA